MIRSTIVEDIFYPGDAELLRKQLQTAFLDTDVLGANAPVAVAPYGGYAYSLRYITAALKAIGTESPEVLILLAPPSSGEAGHLLLPQSDSFETPFGALLVAMDLVDRLKISCGLFIDDEVAHLQNHSIEVLLPAIHYHFGPVQILPILVPRIGVEHLRTVTDALSEIQGEIDSRILIGANLSGFTTPDEADSLSRKMIRLLLTSPGVEIVESLSTFESPPRSTWPLAVGHILAGANTRPRILSRGTFDTEYEGDVGTVALSAIAYLNM